MKGPYSCHNKSLINKPVKLTLDDRSRENRDKWKLKCWWNCTKSVRLINEVTDKPAAGSRWTCPRTSKSSETGMRQQRIWGEDEQRRWTLTQEEEETNEEQKQKETNSRD